MAKNTTQKQEFRGWYQHIEGDMRVFADVVEYRKNGKKSSFLRATTSVARKNDDGTYSNAYMPVTFSRECGIELEEGRNDVHVSDGFITCDAWEDKDGKVRTRVALVVTKAEVIL